MVKEKRIEINGRTVVFKDGERCPIGENTVHLLQVGEQLVIQCCGSSGYYDSEGVYRYFCIYYGGCDAELVRKQ